MSRLTGANPPPDPAVNDASGYTVVARRYRPQRFEEVVGQDHVVQALRNAIKLNRVTHAYLFSGTRGVGKTSIARIFAKCLNCIHGPTAEPCLKCDICQAIAVGQDVDVIEIDGASNNGVEAVRELRQNAGLRPSRSRYKIYYIDEVHMLSTGAFNALLKTLEEPPEHVKFFFATTEPNKIPITVLSRCQRYDFAGITPEQTVATLAQICESEGVKADEDALRTIARRASGSMRDAQSLLEQMLSFGGERLTVELVLQMLGIASDERTLDLLDALSRREPAEALKIADDAISHGVQPTELLAGVLDFLRDAMVLSAGANVALLSAGTKQRSRIAAIVERWPLDTILAAQQILAEARGRLRGSPHTRILTELALVRVARLENLVELGELIARLSAAEGSGPAPAEKKKLAPAEHPSSNGMIPAPAPPASLSPARPEAPRSAPAQPVQVAEPQDAKPVEVPTHTSATPPWDLEAIQAAWQDWAKDCDIALGPRLSRVPPQAILGPNTLVLMPETGYTWIVDALESPEHRAKVEPLVSRWLGRSVEIRFQRPIEQPSQTSRNATVARKDSLLSDDPFIRNFVELFEARQVRVEMDDGGDP